MRKRKIPCLLLHPVSSKRRLKKKKPTRKKRNKKENTRLPHFFSFVEFKETQIPHPPLALYLIRCREGRRRRFPSLLLYSIELNEVEHLTISSSLLNKDLEKRKTFHPTSPFLEHNPDLLRRIQRRRSRRTFLPPAFSTL